MSDPRADRVAAAARACGADWAILTSVDAVAYAAGHVPAIEAGPSPFAGGPTTAGVSADGAVALLCNELERQAAEVGWASVVRTYEGLGYRAPTPREDKQAEGARTLLSELGVGGTVAVQVPSSASAAATGAVVRAPSVAVTVTSVASGWATPRTTRSFSFNHCAISLLMMGCGSSTVCTIRAACERSVDSAFK